jgi:hypothetical protein
MSYIVCMQVSCANAGCTRVRTCVWLDMGVIFIPDDGGCAGLARCTDNDIGDAGAAAISAALEKNKSLTSLDLGALRAMDVYNDCRGSGILFARGRACFSSAVSCRARMRAHPTGAFLVSGA